MRLLSPFCFVFVTVGFSCESEKRPCDGHSRILPESRICVLSHTTHHLLWLWGCGWDVLCHDPSRWYTLSLRLTHTHSFNDSHSSHQQSTLSFSLLRKELNVPIFLLSYYWTIRQGKTEESSHDKRRQSRLQSRLLQTSRLFDSFRTIKCWDLRNCNVQSLHIRSHFQVKKHFENTSWLSDVSSLRDRQREVCVCVYVCLRLFRRLFRGSQFSCGSVELKSLVLRVTWQSFGWSNPRLRLQTWKKVQFPHQSASFFK